MCFPNLFLHHFIDKTDGNMTMFMKKLNVAGATVLAAAGEAPTHVLWTPMSLPHSAGPSPAATQGYDGVA